MPDSKDYSEPHLPQPTNSKAPAELPFTLSPIVGFEAWKLHVVNTFFAPGETIWLKLGHNCFFVGEVHPSGNFGIWSTTGSSQNRRKRTYHSDAYQHLSELAGQIDGGVFYIPGKPTEYPLKDYCLASNNLSIEMDEGTREQQQERIQWFSRVSGIIPTIVNTSGGKSLHEHIKLRTAADQKTRTWLQKLLAIAFRSDPAVVSPHQPMRLAGFDRKEKNNHQSILFHSNASYTVEEVLEGLKRIFEALQWTFPLDLSDDRWRECRRLIAAPTFPAHISAEEQARLTIEHYENQVDNLRKVLAKPESDYNPPPRQGSPPLREFVPQSLTLGHSTNLIDLVNEANDRLGAEAFDWGGHRWKSSSNNKRRGDCPFHQSKSKTAGWLAKRKNGSGWGYACPVCTDNRQINAFSYHLALKYGLDAPYPKGQQFVEEVREFIARAGLKLPDIHDPLYRQEKIDSYREPVTTVYQQSPRRELFSKLSEIRKVFHEQSYLTSAEWRALVNSVASELGIKPIYGGYSSGTNTSPGDTPTPHWQEPPEDEYAAYIAWEKEQERCLEAEDKENFLTWLKGNLCGLAKGYFKGFGQYTLQTSKKLESTPVILPEIIKYAQERPLPSPEDYKGRPAPKIIFRKKQRLEVYQRLKQAGWKVVLDRSFMGLGKSHDAGRFFADPSGEAKTWYFDLNHRNPSVETIEHYRHDVPVCHDGLVYHPKLKTALGNPHLIWASLDKEKNLEQTPAVESVCHWANKFILLGEKGYNNFDRYDICSNCRYEKEKVDVGEGEKKSKCATSVGKGYGFRYLRQQALTYQNLRASINSALDPVDYDYSKDSAFFEEASRIITGTRTISAHLQHLDDEMARLEQIAPDIFQALQPLRFKLRPLLSKQQKLPKFGFDHAQLMELLGEPDESIREAQKTLHQYQIAIPDLFKKPDSTSVTGFKGNDDYQENYQDYKEKAAWVRNYFKREAHQATDENFNKLPANFLIPLLDIWCGEEEGALRLTQDRGQVLFKVTVPDKRHAELVKALGFSVLLEATGDKIILGNKLELNPDEIIEVEQELPPMSNLTVHHVEISGMKSGDYSDRCIERIKALMAHIKARHGETVPYLGLKKYWKAFDLDGWWFNHNRGTNEYKGLSTIAAFGSPNINVGVVQDEYQTLFGSLEGFNDYYQKLVNSEILQLIGRQRPHLYPAQDFNLYLIGTEIELGFLDEFGIKVSHQHGLELTPDAGERYQARRLSMVKFGLQLLESGKELNEFRQETFAKEFGFSQKYISKLTRDIGWKGFKSLLLLLYNSLYRSSSKNQPDLDLLSNPHLREWLDLPLLELLEEVTYIIRERGWDTLKKLLSYAHPRTQMRVLGALASVLLPGQMVDEFLRECDPIPI